MNLEQIAQRWSDLTIKRQVIAGVATVAMFLAVLGLGRLATRPDMALLYSGLETASAGEVVQALEARGVAYQIRGDTILVDADSRDELRLTMASEGLPSNPTRGYEILDEMSGFGTTSQMFDAAYWRAKEGELARTLSANPSVQSARVHIANAATRPFQREVTPTASVMLTPAGGTFSAEQARAVRFLVASAVSGLTPENVSVIDSNAGVVLAGTEVEPGTSGVQDRAVTLKRNVERLLEARVGYGKAIVEVAIDTISERETISERQIDPASRVAISEDVMESNATSSDEGGGDVTVASNVPDGDAAETEGSSQSRETETRSRQNFEVSETLREVEREPGAINRISTAVLVDGLRVAGPDGTETWEPRPEAEMAALRELVAAAVGFDESRGDILSLQTMQFQPAVESGTAPATASLLGQVDPMRAVQLGVFAAVAVALGLFVVRPILAGPTQALPAAGDGQGESLQATTALTGEIDPEDAPGGIEALPDPTESTADGASPVVRLRRLIDERQADSMKILQKWMEDKGEKA